MFIGREAELSKLNQMYQSSRFEFAVIYGRRRVGKTTLINEFCKEKKAIYFMAVETVEKENLQHLSNAVFQVTEPGKPMPVFDRFRALLEYVAQVSSNERIILVIDEFPYLAASNPAVTSILQEMMDQQFKQGKLFLILCGSSMSFMEYQVLGYKSPLYGRRTAQFKVLPFPFQETMLMLPGRSLEEQSMIYGMTGGIPEYLSHIDPAASFQDNVISLFLDKSGRLFEEPSNLLKQELRDPSTYNAVISAIAGGASKINEIATKVGIENSACSNRIQSLISLGLVKKETPVTETPGRKTIYLLDDLMFRFWYRFVLHNLNAIAASRGDQDLKMIYEQQIAPHLNTYMGYIFEEICKEYLWSQVFQKKTPFFFSEMGRWWGPNHKKKRQEEIDLLAFSGNSALYAECKWTNAAVTTGILTDLMEKSALFPYTDPYFYIFSKSGFTKDCRSFAASRSNVRLITLSEMWPMEKL